MSHEPLTSKPKIDNTQLNSKCWFCGDRDETVNHMISKTNAVNLHKKSIGLDTTGWER